MPKLQDVPVGVKAFVFHGLELDWKGEVGSNVQARGDCPFCGKEGKFYVNIDTSEWHCFSCHQKGNGQSFLRALHEHLTELGGSYAEYEAFALERGLLHADTLREWGVMRSSLKEEWLVPGYAADGRLVQLYRYAGSSKRHLIPTAGFGHGLHGVPLLYGQGGKPGKIYVCEGVWDGMALWEILNTEEAVGVLAVPGCGIWNDDWSGLLEGKEVVFLYDSDHPRTNQGRVMPPAGYDGIRLAVEKLAACETPPRSMSYLKWGEGGYDAILPSGYDLRDCLTTFHADDIPTVIDGQSVDTPSSTERMRRWQELQALVSPVPDEWLKAGRAASVKAVELQELPCTSWKELENSWRRAFQWNEGLSKGLSCMLATITSTEAAGDQLWLRVLSPPSSGKSVLCEALSVARKYVVPVSTLRGFHSGYKVDAAGSEDVSLLARLRNKTLVVKDGDTLLQSPNLGQILSEARDIYDRVSRASYRNRLTRTYEGHSMTWILCGTESLRALDKSELGERMLDCVLVEDMSDEEEDEIAWRVALRADADLSSLSLGKKQESEEIVRAKRLTGGYVSYLRRNAHRLLSEVSTPDHALRYCQRLAKFVSIVRARPSLQQEEKAQRELSFRLTVQHVRLARCLAVVLQRKKVDSEVMKRVRAVALDTSRGRMLDIVKVLAPEARRGLELMAVATLTHESESKQRARLRFLRDIGAVESFAVKAGSGYRSKVRWRLSESMARLHAEVMGGVERNGHTGNGKAGD